jgi:hypothetical protein
LHSLPFKCNLQRYSVVLMAAFEKRGSESAGVGSAAAVTTAAAIAAAAAAAAKPAKPTPVGLCTLNQVDP